MYYLFYSTTLVGRDTTRSKVLFSDLNVSSVHCSIERTVNDDRKNVVFIRDYSMSGTYLYSEETKVLEKIEKDQSREVSSGTEVILIPSGANQDRVSFIIKFEDLQNIQVSESEIFYNRLLQSCLNLISFWQNNIGSDNDFSSLAEVLSSFCGILISICIFKTFRIAATFKFNIEYNRSVFGISSTTCRHYN